MTELYKAAKFGRDLDASIVTSITRFRSAVRNASRTAVSRLEPELIKQIGRFSPPTRRIVHTPFIQRKRCGYMRVLRSRLGALPDGVPERGLRVTGEKAHRPHAVHVHRARRCRSLVFGPPR